VREGLLVAIIFVILSSILEPRHIMTRPKNVSFLPRSQPKQKPHILPQFCWEPRPYAHLSIFNLPSSPPETLGSHHGSTTIPSIIVTSETPHPRSVTTIIFFIIVRVIHESRHHHGTSMFFIHENVNTTLA